MFSNRDVTIEVESADDTEDQREGNGYELLPTNNEEVGGEENGDKEDEEDFDDGAVEFGFSTFDGQEFQTMTSTNYHHLLAASEERGERPEPEGAEAEKEAIIPQLDTSQIETIKNIMSNISIPDEAIPKWANTVTDEQLKQVVNQKVSKSKPEGDDGDNWAVFE